MVQKVDAYKLNNKIGETNFATLYEAVRVNEQGDYDELRYAIKEYKDIDSLIDYPNKEKVISQHIYNNSMESINIPITQLIIYEGKKYGIMDYRKNGVFLRDFIEALEAEYGPGNIPFKLQYRILKRILKALDNLHNIVDRDTKQRVGGYLHMDLQPSNIFLENAGTYKAGMGSAKFIDFQSSLEIDENGVARRASEETVFVTKGYSAPEIYNKYTTDFFAAADIYSVGAIAARLLTGKNLNYDYADYMDVISQLDYTNADNVYGNKIVKLMYKNIIQVALATRASYRFKTANAMYESLNRVKQCYDCVLEGNYYGVLDVCYTMCMSKNDFAYLDMDKNEYHNVIKRLKENSYSKIVYAVKGAYMVDVLLGVWEKNSTAKGYYVDSFNDLMSCGISFNNFLRRTDRAIELYNKVDISRLSVDDYIKIANRIMVSYVARFDYNQAREICQQVIEFLEERKKVDERVAASLGLNMEAASRNVDLGRAYSGMGYYATICGQEGAVEYFEKALEEFGDDAGNKAITMSRILQYAIYKKDYDLYRKYKAMYLSENPLDAFLSHYSDSQNKVLDGGVFISIGSMISFLIYLKGLYTFEMEQVDDVTIENLMFVVEHHSYLDKQSHLHPLEIIYKYIGLIIEKYKGPIGDALFAMDLSIECLKKDRSVRGGRMSLLSVISKCTMWQKYKLFGGDWEGVYSDLYKRAKRHGWSELIEKLESCKDLSSLCPYEIC